MMVERACLGCGMIHEMPSMDSQGLIPRNRNRHCALNKDHIEAESRRTTDKRENNNVCTLT
jgi:hypothetical protein